MSVARVLALTLLVCAAQAQTVHIGNIDFYGLHKVTPEKILQVTHINPGGGFPASKGDLEDLVASIPGVVDVHVEAVCCDGSAADLFIGIEEQGAPHTAFRSPPSGSATLPTDIFDTYNEFLSAVQRAAVKGSTDEDMSAGHPMMKDPAARALQEKFVTIATERLEVLRNVLRTASLPEERAAAAAIMGYAPRKADIIDDLQAASTDSDPAVRTNAIRGLTAIGVLAQKNPGLNIKISPTWFVELLHSVELSDRVEATRALVTLTDSGNRAALDLIKERALPDVVEMARWKSLRYALPPFLLVGRIAGMKDEDIHKSWEEGQRDSVIEKVQPSGKKR